MTIITLITMWALAFAIKETDGPYDIIRKARDWLLHNATIGTYVFNLLQCYFCLGTYSGIIVYILSIPISQWNIFTSLIWGFTGAGSSFIINVILERIGHHE